MAQSSAQLPEDKNYFGLLDDLKQRIRAAQVKAVLAVNQELVLLYWDMGRRILTQQASDGWGSHVIERLSRDLKQEFPDMKGFSTRNLGYMKAFAAAWPDERILQQAAAKIPWGHNMLILEKLKSPEERQWYIQKTIENGWSRNVLALQIENGIYNPLGSATSNFESTLPAPQSDLAQQLLKDPYNFEFLTLSEDAKEQDLKRALLARMRDFLLELGIGFSFVGSQYQLDIGGEDFYLDMLFFHIELRCYVIIELKMGDFKAEYSGKMNLYVSAVDDQIKKDHHNETIGIIICRSKNNTIAEYALRNLNTPIAVSTHKLPKELKASLPTAEQIEMGLEAAVAELEKIDT
jgi:predicted nuclease of restriction endonuclease-like (RecB) superfamily